MSQSLTLAFVGLGAMGGPMAAHLAAPEVGAETLLLYNRTANKAQALAAELGARVQAVSLPEIARADLIVSCLPTSQEVSEVLAQLPSLKRGAVWVDCTSGHPDAARVQADQLAQQGVTFLDAPVSGGTAGAQAGTLTVMVGGDAQVLDRVRPYLAFAALVRHVGPSGAGFALKAVNNILLATQLLATGEGLAALARCGVSPDAALEVINASSGRSNASQNLIPQRVLTREFPVTFKLGLLAKDADIALDVALSVQASTPLLAQVAGLTRGASRLIGPDHDHTAALQLIEQLNGLELTGERR